MQNIKPYKISLVTLTNYTDNMVRLPSGAEVLNISFIEGFATLIIKYEVDYSSFEPRRFVIVSMLLNCYEINIDCTYIGTFIESNDCNDVVRLVFEIPVT